VTIARVAPDQSMAVSFEVAGEGVESVGGHYADSLAAEGWSTTLRDDSAAKLVYAVKNNRNVTVLVRPGEGVTLVDIVVAELP
jgi:hypothetical protein